MPPVAALDTYAHLWPDSEDRTREAVEVLLGVPLTAQRRPSAAAET
jgi:hypothetical protein